jgi:site-specific recombinase XerD
MEDDNTIEGVTIVPQVTANVLDNRKQADYRHHRESLIKWLLTFGKSPDEVEGYSAGTTKVRAQKIDQFYRWVWKHEDGYTLQITHDHADEWMKEIAYSDIAASSRPTYQKSVKSLFKWKHHEHDGEIWEPTRTFSDPNDGVQSRDYLTKDERSHIREAALEYGSIPHYNSISPQERRDLKTYLARRFQKPVNEVTKADWKRANGWKYPTMVWVSLDTALRPIEVKKAKTGWVNLDRGTLQIPESASKNDQSWEPVLQDRTINALQKWLEQRETLDDYRDNDKLWLTKYGNPYDSNSLSTLIKNLCDIADIDRTNRQVTWYSIRRGMITGMIDVADLSTAQIQARHKDPRSTMRYDQAPPERRRDALEDLG